MQWWQIFLLTIVGTIIVVVGEVYLRLAPERKKREEGRRKAHEALKNALEGEIIRNAKVFRSVRLSHLEEFSGNHYISAKLRKALTFIVDLGKEYEEWRWESWQLINTHVRLAAQSKEFEELNESLKLFIGSIVGVFDGYELSIGEPVYQATYEGNLTFELARDTVLKDKWDTSTKVHDETIKLKDVIEGGQFHKFIEELKKLHERRPLKMLRNARQRLLKKAQLILKEVTQCHKLRLGLLGGRGFMIL